MLAHLKIWPVEGKNNRKGKGVDWKSIVSKESSSVTDILIEIPCIVARKKSMHTNPNFTHAAIYPIYSIQRHFKTHISIKSLAVVLPTGEAAKTIMVSFTISLWFNQSIKKFQKLCHATSPLWHGYSFVQQCWSLFIGGHLIIVAVVVDNVLAVDIVEVVVNVEVSVVVIAVASQE